VAPRSYVFRGVTFASKVGNTKDDRFEIGDEPIQRIDCINDNGPECFISVEVSVLGDRYVTTPEGAVWKSEEYELAGRKSPGKRTATIPVQLQIIKAANRDLRPAEERILIKVYMRRHPRAEPKSVGHFSHTIQIS
jgi:hypothetical protein